MDVEETYNITSLNDLEDGDIFVCCIGETPKYCIKTFDTLEGGERRTHFTVLGSADGNDRRNDLEIMAINLEGEKVLAIDDCKLALPTEAKAYSFEGGFAPELGKIFILDEQQHLCVRGDNAGPMFLLNLANGELTRRPAEHRVVTVCEWKLERVRGPKTDDLLVFQAVVP